MTINILHLITGLNTGGAEISLYNLLGNMDRSNFENQVISLIPVGEIGEKIRALEIPVTSLELRPGQVSLVALSSLVRELRSKRPDIIQTWMYHADLAGGLAACLAGSPPVVWGLHHTMTGTGAVKPATYSIVRVNALLSHILPARIVCCAEATRRTHALLGYSHNKLIVIPNGIDPAVFHPDEEARLAVRRELGIAEGSLLVGLCARFHPQKDHANFMRAAGILHKSIPGAHFLLWGQGVDLDNDILGGWVREEGVEHFVHLLGQRGDTPRLMSAMDLVCLSSAYGEALPLAVGEAMSCETPCVVTDIGDSALLVGRTGRIVPPRDPEALAAAWADLLSMSTEDRRALGRLARQRILDNYSLEKMVTAYANLYQDIITHGRFRK